MKKNDNDDNDEKLKKLYNNKNLYFYPNKKIPFDDSFVKKNNIDVMYQSVKTYINDIKETTKTKPLRTLSPGNENELLYQRINENYVLGKDFKQDTLEHYYAGELNQQELKTIASKPLFGGLLGTTGVLFCIRLKSPALVGGATTSGYVFYSAVEAGIDNWNVNTQHGINEKYQKQRDGGGIFKT